MSIKKSFVVKNGLEVADNLIFTNDQKVGVGTTAPEYTLSVIGDVSLTGRLLTTPESTTVATVVGIASSSSRASITGIDTSNFRINDLIDDSDVIIDPGTKVVAIGNSSILISPVHNRIFGSQSVTLTITRVTYSGEEGDVLVSRGSNQSPVWKQPTGELNVQEYTGSDLQYPVFVDGSGISTASIASTQLSFIPSSGNLGLGTTNPTSKLSVFGNISATGIISATGARISNTTIGIGSTEVVVGGDLRVTGIATFGTSSITVNGINNTISIGTFTSIASGIATFGSSGITVNGINNTISVGSSDIVLNGPSKTISIGSSVVIGAGIISATKFVGEFVGIATTARTVNVVALSGSSKYYPTFATSVGFNSVGIRTSSIFLDPTTNYIGIGVTLAKYNLDVAGSLGINGYIYAPTESEVYVKTRSATISSTNLNFVGINTSGITVGDIIDDAEGSVTNRIPTNTSITSIGIGSVGISNPHGLLIGSETINVSLSSSNAVSEGKDGSILVSLGSTGPVTWKNAAKLLNVGIGTTSIDDNYRLVFTNTYGDDTLTEFNVDENGIVYNPVGNYLGIGSTAPTTNLDVVGNAKLSGTVTATEFLGSGVNLAGIVTQITAGIGISLTPTNGKGKVEIQSYTPTGKTIYVKQTGNDDNTGLSENYAKKTIKAASQVAVFGDTIKVYPGVYVEENPVVLKKTVSVEGTELRNCVVTPKYPYLDLFHVNNGCHITDMSFIGPDMTDGASVVALQPLEGVAVDRYFDAARMIRLNLDYIARESVGFLTSGFSGFAGNHREQDAARLIDKNLNYIAAETVGFLTAPTGYNFTLSGGDYTNCKEDVVSVFSAVSYDLKANSNRKSVGAALSYFNSSGGLIHITGIATQQATIAAFDYAVGIAKSVINNVSPPISYQSGIGSVAQVIDPSVIAVAGGCVGVGTTIAQLVGIVTSAIGAASTSGLPAIRYGVTLESADCADDIKDIWKCAIHDITRGGNSRCVAAGKSYYDADWNLIPQILKNPGEVQQTVATVDYSFNVARAIVNNVTWGGYPVGLGTTVTNAFYNNVTGVTTITAINHGLSKDDAVKIVGLGFTCPSGPGIVTYPTGSLGYIFNVKSVVGVNTFEVIVGQSTLPHTYVSGGTVQKYTSFQNNFYQVKDLGMQKDPLTGFNNGINGCANVVSAMRSCVGVVTSIVGLGSTAFTSVGIRTTYPGNSGIGFTTVLGITSAVYDEQTGKTTIVAPGLKFVEGEPIEIRGLNFSCDSGGSISTQAFPSGRYGFDFFIDKVNTDGSFEVYVGPSTLPHTYVGGGVVVDRAVGVTTATYDNTTGITTIKATGLSIETGDLVKIRNLEFSCPSGSGTTTLYPTGNNGYEFRVLDIITDKPYGITSAVYDNTTGITTITAPGIGVTFNDIIELRNLEFSCTSGAGTTTLYPTGNNGYDFRVLSSIGSTFTVNVGPSTIPHNYVSGGTAVNRTRTANDTFTINVGPSTIPHTYVSGGIAIPPFSRGVGPITQGPYVRNCTNFIPKSIGMKVDGFAAEPGDQDDIGVTGTMSVDSYTQYNQGGIGVSITNGAYAQLVSIFTICDDIAIFTGSGGQCDITNSNSSFGRLGLFSDGVGNAETKSIYRSSGVAATTAPEKTNEVVVSGVGNYRPYDGQVCYFGQLYYFVDTIGVTNGGSGYTSSPRVNISAPEGANGITAQATATVENGSVVSVNIVNSGTQYAKPPTITIDPPTGAGTQATARATNMQPIYYKVSAATLPSAGISTISFLQTLNNTVSAGTTVYFSRTSLQLATTISFEFVGAGTNINTAKPALGGVVVPENQVVQTNGGSVVYTSTDQAGNFKIGDGVVINQATGQITGRDFTKALFVTLTPFILALAE
jgi:hypothetical protein